MKAEVAGSSPVCHPIFFMDNINTQILNKIDTSLWNQGHAKSLDHLIKEINSGEAFLSISKNNKIIRSITVIHANVFYIDDSNQKYKLIEEKQIFKNGRQRHRKLKTSIGEKIKPNENINEALVRGLKEELDIKFTVKIAQNKSIKTINKSSSYPGLITKSIVHKFDVYIDSRDYKPEGYIEHQSDKDNYFTWQEIKD